VSAIEGGRPERGGVVIFGEGGQCIPCDVCKVLGNVDHQRDDLEICWRNGVVRKLTMSRPVPDVLDDEVAIVPSTVVNGIGRS